MRHVTRSRKSQLYLREPLGEQTVAVDLNKLPVRVPAERTGQEVQVYRTHMDVIRH